VPRGSEVLAVARYRARQALDALASLVFPAPCRICEQTLLTASRVPVCQACLEAIQPVTGPMCAKCGRPFHSPLALQAAGAMCHLCRRDVYHFDAARSYAAYDDVMVRAVILLKYHAVKPLGAWFARRVYEMVRANPALAEADEIVSVPLHESRRRERGYNQVDLFARPLARMLRMPLRSYLLVRTRPRPEKLKLTRRERWLTVRGAYAMRGTARIDKARILLLDDVFTTGATLDACARALRDAGAARVTAVTLARVAPAWAPVPPGTEAIPERAKQHPSSHGSALT